MTFVPEPPPPGGGGQSSNRTIMIVLSYLWLLALIPLLMEKEDREVQWHAKHGLVLTALDVIAIILLNVFAMVMANFDFGCTGCMLWSVFWIADLVVRILCIVKGVGGQRFTVPVLTDLGQKINL